ncbi:major facilitator superfamily domain-containing protein [Xylariales sp. PMI_506]|nr:major facilitator superfamily domain-containing protein [Xylariales sp. PMI_506]
MSFPSSQRTQTRDDERYAETTHDSVVDESPREYDTEEHNAEQNDDSDISTWALLKQPQMAVLCFSRIGDPLATTSLYVYLIFQLRYLSPAASDADIAMQAGLLVGAKTFAKVCTGVYWGMLADSHGRKGVMLVGLLSSCVTCIGYGFSTTFAMAIFWQVVQGMMSAEVAIARTLVAELYSHHSLRVRSRALLLLPLTDSLGMVLGPLIGGYASQREGLSTLSRHPYALPNLIIAFCYGVSALGVLFLVRDTRVQNQAGRWQTSSVPSDTSWLSKVKLLLGFGRGSISKYKPISVDDQDSIPLTSAQHPSSPDPPEVREPSVEQAPSQTIPFLKIWTSKVIFTMLAHFVITGHITAFAVVWSTFLSTPIATGSPSEDKSPREAKTPLFSGGVGLSPPEIGTLTTCATILGALLQVLLLPRLSTNLGTVRVWRLALWLFPLVYFVAPFPLLVATPSTDSTAGTTLAAWAAISVVLLFFMSARTGAQPPMVILINECVPHPSRRATVNTIGTSVANLARCVFPVIVGGVFSIGLRNKFVAAPFWLLSGIAVLAIVASRWVVRDLDPGAVLKKGGNDNQARLDAEA